MTGVLRFLALFILMLPVIGWCWDKWKARKRSGHDEDTPMTREWVTERLIDAVSVGILLGLMAVTIVLLTGGV